MSGLFALNVIVALLVGGLAVVTIVLIVFVLLTQLKSPKKFWQGALRVVQVLALIGFVGAFIMQAFGLWIT